MKLRIKRAHNYKVNILFTMTAVLALVAQPIYGLVASQVANAITSDPITTEQQLLAAAEDKSITTVSIKASFDIHQKINFSGRNVTVDGNGNKLTFVGDTSGWQGNYLIQAYQNIMQVKNLSLTGGDAALYANGATLKLGGVVNVSGNEFGGIEVSQGSNVATPAVLDATNATIINTTESFKQPTAWIDNLATTNATVNGTFFDNIRDNQKHFYLNETSIPDTTKPIIESVSMADNAVVKSSYSLSIHATDNRDLKRVVVNFKQNGKVVSGGNNIILVSGKDQTIEVALPAGLQEGAAYTVSIGANDQAGNTAQTISLAFTVDDTKPTVVLRENQTIKSSGSFFLTSQTVRVQPQDENLGKVFVNGVEYAQYYGSGSFGINWIIAQNPTVDRFVITAEDKAGNMSDEYIVRIDRTVPTISIKTGTGASDGSLGTHPYYRQISFKLYDKDKNLKEVSLNGYIYTRSGEWNDLNWQNINKSHLIQGENTVIVRDYEGNSSQLTFFYDSIAPTATFDYSNNHGNAVTADDVTVTMTTTEAVATPDGWIKVDDTTFTKVYSENGKYSVVITDLAGNSSTAKYEVKRIDKIAPVFDIVDGSTINTATATVQITEDNISHVTVDGVLVAHTGSKPYYVTVSGEGSHTVVATDKAGNQATVSFTIDSVVDDDNGDNGEATNTDNNDEGSDDSTDQGSGSTDDDQDSSTTGSSTVSSSTTDTASSALAVQQSIITPLTITTPIIGTTGVPYMNAILNGQNSIDDSSVLAAEDNQRSGSSDSGEVLSDEDSQNGWSVINVVLSSLTAIISILALIGIANREDSKRIGARLVTAVVAAGAIITIFFTEDFSASMIWLNWWTILYAALLILQLMIKPRAHKELQ